MFDPYESPRVSTIATLSRGLWRAAAALASAGTLVTLALPAQAQPLGAVETFAITGEELTGFTAESSKYDDLDEEQNTYNTSRFSFALSNGARVGVHYFLWRQVSLGGTLGFLSDDHYEFDFMPIEQRPSFQGFLKNESGSFFSFL